MWHLHHDFLGHPCTRSNRAVTMRRAAPGWTSLRRRPAACDDIRPTAFADDVRDGVSQVLVQRGIDYKPVGGATSWLWCLGGPDLYRRPLPGDHEEFFDPSACLDLNVWVCAEHQVFSAELYPFDIVDEAIESEPPYRRSSKAEPLAEDVDVATEMFHTRLEGWLNEILVRGDEQATS